MRLLGVYMNVGQGHLCGAMLSTSSSYDTINRATHRKRARQLLSLDGSGTSRLYANLTNLT